MGYRLCLKGVNFRLAKLYNLPTITHFRLAKLEGAKMDQVVIEYVAEKIISDIRINKSINDELAGSLLDLSLINIIRKKVKRE